jgi:hypothetical protein
MLDPHPYPVPEPNPNTRPEPECIPGSGSTTLAWKNGNFVLNDEDIECIGLVNAVRYGAVPIYQVGPSLGYFIYFTFYKLRQWIPYLWQC